MQVISARRQMCWLSASPTPLSLRLFIHLPDGWWASLAKEACR